MATKRIVLHKQSQSSRKLSTATGTSLKEQSQRSGFQKQLYTLKATIVAITWFGFQSHRSKHLLFKLHHLWKRRQPQSQLLWRQIPRNQSTIGESKWTSTKRSTQQMKRAIKRHQALKVTCHQHLPPEKAELLQRIIHHLMPSETMSFTAWLSLGVSQ